MKILNLSIALALLAFGCTGVTKKDNKLRNNMSENILLAKWDTPFGVPPFDKIKSEDYMPAFEEAFRRHALEIDAIVNNKEEPTFKNTIEALELSGKDLGRVRNIFSAVQGANTDSILKATAKKVAPMGAKHSDAINLNDALYKRIASIYNKKESLNLTEEESRLLEKTYERFVRAGVGVAADKKDRLKEINERLASLRQQFGEQLLDETNNFEYHTTNKDDLGNLPESLVALAAEEAKKRGHDKGWSFTLQRPSINPFLQSSPNAAARKILFDGYAMRANNGNEEDNKEVIKESIALRKEKAEMLGYDSHAAYILSNNMAETPKAVFDFMDQLWPSALNMAKEERKALAAVKKNEGQTDVFKGSDWRHYVEKVRKERYAYDEEETRPYFEVGAVRDGALALATKLFGLQFKKLDNMPKWHETQEVFEVLESDGKHLGVIYFDFFARDSKRGGAWMNSLRNQSNVAGMITPIVTNNFNYPAPADGNPSLLSFSEAETMFHEFGHGLHGLFSNVKYKSLSGTNVPRDFVEFPSQVMENWMSEPEVLRMFAKHYKTGEVIPDALIKKVKEANSFNGGFGTVEYMAAAYLDMLYHTAEEEIKDVNAFEKQAMDKLGLIEEIIPRYRSTYFSHIFAGGYSAGYYSYLWSEVLDADAFMAFKETGDLFDAEVAKRYRKMLSLGGSKKGMDLYKEFRGKEPKIDALIEKKFK